MKLTPAQRDKFDGDVLAALSTRDGHATYVLRNTMDWPGKPWHRKGVETSAVLRACRRLEKRGLAAEDHRFRYAVMKCWRITDLGRQALSNEEPKP